MAVYVKNSVYTLYQGKMQEELANIPDCSVDSIVTDPPYELGFMGKSWDSSGVAFQADTWKRCLRVLKPGGYLLAFGGSRTYHRIACAIEDAGFEIRDTIMWIYGSGFPKSLNIGLAIDRKNGVESTVIGGARSGVSSRAYQSEETTTAGEYEIKKAQNEWSGWGTALKPAFEPIIVARKPFDGSLVDNILEWGVGGINIDECRVGTDYIGGGTMPDLRDVGRKSKESIGVDKLSFGQVRDAERIEYEGHFGRFPANVITDGSDEATEGFPYSKGACSQNNFSDKPMFRGNSFHTSSTSVLNINNGYREWYNDEGSAMRYFYCAKASKKDRDEGLDGFEESRKAGYGYDHGYQNPAEGMFKDRQTLKRNTHPTVKPTDLMQYLVRLVSPKGSTVLDPFMGSGSTGKACMIENTESGKDYKFIGIEMTTEYLPIADARIKYWINRPIEVEEDNREEIKKGQETVYQLW